MVRGPASAARHVKAPPKVLARLTRFLWPYRARIAVASVALLVAAACVLALGQGLRLVIDAGFGSGDPRLLDRALAALIAIAVALATATWFRFYLMMSTGERVVTDLRRAVFDRVLGLDPAFFEATRTGEVISRLTNDTTLVQQVIGYGFSMFVRNALMMLGAAVMLFVTSWKLAVLVLVGVPVTLIPILLAGRRVRRLSRASRTGWPTSRRYIDEAVHEIRTVQAYAHEDADRANFAQHAEAAYRAGARACARRPALVSSVMLIAFCAIGVILWIGGHDVLAGRISAGELSAFVFYAAIVATGAGTVSEVWGELQQAAGATERLIELLETRPSITRAFRALSRRRSVPCAPSSSTARPSPMPGRPDVPALERFSLRVSPGERVALVGPSGAGKIHRVRAAVALLRPAKRRGTHRRRGSARHGSACRPPTRSPWCRRTR
jgi:ATP-binding cassette, subfamily B, bacterial